MVFFLGASKLPFLSLTFNWKKNLNDRNCFKIGTLTLNDPLYTTNMLEKGFKIILFLKIPGERLTERLLSLIRLQEHIDGGLRVTQHKLGKLGNGLPSLIANLLGRD